MSDNDVQGGKEGVAADVVAQCRRLHAAIDAFDEAAAQALGVARTDLRCLNLLEHGPLSPTALAAALGLTTGSVTALVDRLERKQLVARARHPEDRRGVIVSATPKVFATLGVIYRRCAEQLCQMVEAYPVNQRAFAVRVISDTADAWTPEI